MKRIIQIEIQEPFKILCLFENGEQRMINLEKLLDKQNKYASKILNEHTFRQAKVGSFGEIYWDEIAEIRDLEGRSSPCPFDISAEYVYWNSSLVNN